MLQAMSTRPIRKLPISFTLKVGKTEASDS
jgi:hypothetical protein